jgi:hypothetical protein
LAGSRIRRKGLETWVAVSFCQTRSALLRCIREEVIRGGEFYPGRDNMPVSADILAKIEDFPDRIG